MTEGGVVVGGEEGGGCDECEGRRKGQEGKIKKRGSEKRENREAKEIKRSTGPDSFLTRVYSSPVQHRFVPLLLSVVLPHWPARIESIGCPSRKDDVVVSMACMPRRGIR